MSLLRKVHNSQNSLILERNGKLLWTKYGRSIIYSIIRSISWLKITSTMVKIEDLTKKSNSAKKNFDDEEKVLKLC